MSIYQEAQTWPLYPYVYVFTHMYVYARGHLPALLAGGTDIAPLALTVGAAGFADVVVAVQTWALGVEQEGKGRAAADAAVLVELVLFGQKQTATTLLLQLLLHFTTERDGGIGGEGLEESE